MIGTSRARTTVWTLAIWATAVAAAAADLQTRTARAFDDYVAHATHVFLGRLAIADRALESGVIDGRPTAQEGAEVESSGRLVKVGGGVIHHWSGATFLPGATLDDVVATAQAYDRYPTIYEGVRSSALLGRDGDQFRLYMRVGDQEGAVAATLDVWSTVTYGRGPACAHSISMSETIQEVRNVGKPGEYRLPAGRDSGYLWRATTLTRFVERRGGVSIETETIGLSRSFPPLVGWLVEPIARRVGRRSVERSLQAFRTAVLQGDEHASRRMD